MPNWLGRAISTVSGLLLFGLLAFIFGWSHRHNASWPSVDVIKFMNHWKVFQETGRFAPETFYLRRPDGSPNELFSVAMPERVTPGYRAMLGWEEEEGFYTIRLFDEAGTVIHRWRVDPDKLGGSEFSPAEMRPHGLDFLPDGSVIVNSRLGYSSTFRLDQCSEPVWVETGAYHHSIVVTEDRSAFWTWYNTRDMRDATATLTLHDVETGERLREISFAGDIITASPENAQILTMTQDFIEMTPEEQFRFWGIKDFWHGNDADPLPSRLADAFPMFEPGDLALSLRQIDMIAVMDPETLEIKWWQRGPWQGQHDPDWGADGKLYIFNNQEDRGRSDVVAIDPATREIEFYYWGGDLNFYTQHQGDLDIVAPGILQLVVPGEGRVIEATLSGEVILEMNNLADETWNARVLNARFLPPDFYETLPSCP